MVTNNGDLVGYVLGGCKLERLIGQGGMSAVYLARQLQPERYVAVKVLMPHLDTSSEDYKTFLARFRREANIVAKLEHINIVPLHAYGEERQFAYLVMPYIAGGSLGDVMNTQGTLSLQQTFHYLQQAAAALDYAHKRNVVHRDLKPSNFLLYPNDDRLVLADFGVARIADEHPLSGYEATLTQTGVVPGTLAYMAPEMLQDARNIDHRVDIYALGIVLYQLLSGQLPFTGDLFSLINKHMEEALPPLHLQNPTIPASVDSVLRKATAKRRQERYPTAGQLASDFLNAMDGKAVQPVISESAKEIGRIKKLTVLPLDDLPLNEPIYPNMPIDTLIADMKTATFSPSNKYNKHTDESTAVGDANLPSTGAKSYGTRPRKWSRKIWLLLTASLLIIGLLAAGSWAFFNHTNTSSPDIQQAQQIIQQYYADLNNHDFHAAYNLFAPEIQKRITYDRFAQIAGGVVHVDITVESANQISIDTINIVLTANTQRSIPSGEVVVVSHHVYRLVRRNGVWKILSMRLQI